MMKEDDDTLSQGKATYKCKFLLQMISNTYQFGSLMQPNLFRELLSMYFQGSWPYLMRSFVKLEILSFDSTQEGISWIALLAAPLIIKKR